MLVTFECKAYSNITYFGDVAKQLLRMMERSGTIPSAILADDVPAALEKLQQAVEVQTQNQSSFDKNDDDNDKEPQITMTTRAKPLVELLTAAAKAQCDVMWH